ncbi:hypothetical protein LCGC14_2028900 [marine sediment metagenome]|uniref:Helix-turn-helix domain-containing protein n=1 Tax=marine sediment metagenome TaxID=412755 RepID=A0A0F9EVC7_9ZZZZ
MSKLLGMKEAVQLIGCTTGELDYAVRTHKVKLRRVGCHPVFDEKTIESVREYLRLKEEQREKIKEQKKEGEK